MRMTRLVAALAAGLALLLVAGGVALADSWSMPTQRTYSSEDKLFRFTVTPRSLSGQLDYFSDRVDGKPLAGQLPDGPKAPLGLLERADGRGGWETVWRRDLLNDVSPVSAIISRDGAHVATFDDWHGVGTGDHVVVIYGAGGKTVRSFTLQDLLPEDYIYALPHSVSSIEWNGAHAFSADGRTLVLKVTIPALYVPGASRKHEYVDFRIEAATGRILTTDDPTWLEAVKTAAGVAAAERKLEEERRAWFRAPLVGPATATEREWHRYLWEAFYRIDPEWETSSAATKVLRDPAAADYSPSEKWLREELLDTAPYAGNASIASPTSPENLTRVLANILGSVKPGGLTGRRIYVFAPPQWRDRITALFAPTGATFIFVDPSVPIPQRPERLQR